jgi:hypothetical protein
LPLKQTGQQRQDSRWFLVVCVCQIALERAFLFSFLFLSQNIDLDGQAGCQATQPEVQLF